MSQPDQIRATKLAFVNSVGDNAYSNDVIATELLNMLNDKQIAIFKEFYKVSSDTDLTIDNIAIERKWLKPGGSPDIERTSGYILRDFREGKIGKFILDEIET